MAEGELLKDAMVQERISGRIRAEEYSSTILEVEPTPEAAVGSLRESLRSASDFERISDDSDEPVSRTETRDETAESHPEASPSSEGRESRRVHAARSAAEAT